jgi:tetratricopeptide (TPR) repeat protein
MSLARSTPGWAAMVLVVACLAGFATGAPAQGEGPLAEARAAEARLDFAAAYALLETAMSAAPDSAAPYLARAGLHRKLARPALALADLDRARTLAPDDPSPLVEIGEIWLENNALRQSIGAFDAALERAPEHLPALAGRARAHAKAGLTGNALADFDRALSLAPDDTTLIDARSALIEARAAQRVTAISYDPSALMEPEFRVDEGRPEAADRLVIVEAGNELATDADGVDPAALAQAVDAGALHLTRLFTYTGQDSAIWANLALICGGPEAQAAMRAALTAEEGRAALASIDAGGDLAPLKALVRAAYARSGVDVDRVETCAFNRGQALRYLAEWTGKQEGQAWKGVNFYDFWPVYIWNDTVTTRAEVNARLAGLLPAEPGAPREPRAAGAQGAIDDTGDGETDAAPEDEMPLAQDPQADGPSLADAPDMGAPPASGTASEAQVPAPEDPAPDPTLPPETTAHLPAPVTAEGRVPVELRGIYAPGLVDCLAYGARRDAATTLDEILPALNPLDGPPIGTVLLASQRLHLFNATGTECGLAALPETGSDAAWRGDFACVNALAAGVVTPLELVRIESDGPAPQLEARLGTAEPVTLVQCRPFGLLGRDAAPIWDFDEPGCRSRAPVGGAAFEFRATAGGQLALHITPDGALTEATAPRLRLDGLAWDTGTPTREAGAWRFDLGAFSAASERLELGLFLDLIGPGGGVDLRLPLLGSSAAMARLAACAAS